MAQTDNYARTPAWVGPHLPTGQCAECGQDYSPHGCTAGCAVRPDGSRVCYPCADAGQVRDLIGATRAMGYLSADGRTVTTWTGGTLARVLSCHVSRAARKTYVRAVDVHGQAWYGQGPAASGTYVRLRRVK